MTCFGEPGRISGPARPPRRRQSRAWSTTAWSIASTIVAGVSGGVRVDPSDLVKCYAVGTGKRREICDRKRPRLPRQGPRRRRLVVGLVAVASCRSLPAAVISYLRQETCRSGMWVGMDQFLVRRAEDARPSDPSSSASSCSSTPIVSSATVPSRVPGSTNMTANSARVSQYAGGIHTQHEERRRQRTASAASGASTVADNTPSPAAPRRGSSTCP